jgi:two-component system, NtrC family, sensor kinase
MITALKNPSPTVHVLVVDDEPDIAESLVDLLTIKEGYRVTHVDNGVDALSFLEAAPEAIDVILLDMAMPMMSGLEVLARIRAHEKLKYMRVIMLTAVSDKKIEALFAGADEYITKPYQPHELLARVKTILRTQQLEKQLKRQSRQLASLNRASHIITATLDSRQVLAAAVTGTVAVLGAGLAAIFIRDNNRGYLNCQYLRAPNDFVSTENYPPVLPGVGLIGQALSRRGATAFNEPTAVAEFQPASDAPADFAVQNMLVTTLIVRGHAIGVLAAYNKKTGPFTRVDIDLFDSLASSISRAIENASLFQSVQFRRQELLESRNTLHAVIDGILHAIYTINDAWQLVAVNQTQADQMATPPESLAGQVCYRAFYGRETPCDHCAVAQTLSSQSAQRWPVRWLGPDHLPQEWDVSAYPIPGAKSGAARAVVVWQDRTDERRLENNLIQAGKLTAIGQLAAGVAHEINNPLTVINANAEMLKMFIPMDDENYESVDLIARAGERATKVVRGLLDFARQTRYDFESASLNDSIRQTLDLVAYQFGSANIEVTLDMADELPPVMASWEHLKSVWLNLLVNARDAVQDLPENRRIEISTRSGPNGNQVHVVVRDNGRGMAPAELVHIFEPFYTTKDPGKGTGLGLATSHRIIEQHQGQIEVISNPGEGSTFIVRLPTAGAPAAQQVAATIESDEPTFTQ